MNKDEIVAICYGNRASLKLLQDTLFRHFYLFCLRPKLFNETLTQRKIVRHQLNRWMQNGKICRAMCALFHIFSHLFPLPFVSSFSLFFFFLEFVQIFLREEKSYASDSASSDSLSSFSSISQRSFLSHFVTQRKASFVDEIACERSGTRRDGKDLSPSTRGFGDGIEEMFRIRVDEA